MPAEWEPHAATWMAFPTTAYSSTTSLAEARSAWVAVATAIAQAEPVNLLVRPEDRAAAELVVGGAITLVECPLDDAWARDMGPSFVREADGTIAAVDWVFNGWGAQDWAEWDHDAEVATAVARRLGIEVIASSMVNEGGGIEVNGQGTVIVTETVQLDPGRNPGWDRPMVEAELERCLGATNVIWLPRGLTGDYLEFGTRGHVDLLAKFVDATTVVVHDQTMTSHPDHALSKALQRQLDAEGLTVVPLAAPTVAEVHGRVCDWSYVNCYLANDLVVLGTYDDPADAAASDTLSQLLPSRKVVTVDARPLFSLGGGVHCITQQQPL